VASLGAIAVGCAAGLVTALLHVWFRINPLLAGILTATAAWSVNLLVMGRANIGLIDQETLFTAAQRAGLDVQGAAIVVGGAACLVLGLGLTWFLGTQYGLSLRATGLNIQTARGMGIRTEQRQIVGLMIANGLAASSGALVVQNDGFFDVQAQVGVVVVGLAALMIGRSVIRSLRVFPSVIAVLAGVLIYRFVVVGTLELGLPPSDIRLVTAAIVVAAIVFQARLFSFASWPGTAAATRRRRDRLQFFEDDRVTPII
jgi:putative tryptophan/tyrosine transport system permease protein